MQLYRCALKGHVRSETLKVISLLSASGNYGDEASMSYLVLSTFGLEHGEEHLSVAIPSCFVRGKNLSEAWRRGLMCFY